MTERAAPERCLDRYKAAEHVTDTDRCAPSVNDPDDRALVRRALAGDDRAYGELVRRHQSAALRVAAGICGSTEEARDIVQDAFVKGHRALRSWRGDAPVRASLATIRSNHDRTGASPRHDRRARWPFTNASCTMSLASSVEPQIPAATRSAADWCRRTSSPYARSSPARARRTSTSSSGAVTPGADRSVLLTCSAALYRSDTSHARTVPSRTERHGPSGFTARQLAVSVGRVPLA